MGGWNNGKGSWQSKGAPWNSGGKGTKKGKGKWSKAADWDDGAGEWDDADAQSIDPMVGHVKTQYRIPKKILAAYAGKSGSCIYGDGKPDSQFFDPATFRDFVCAKNSEWMRPLRMGYACSEFAGSMETMLEILDEIGASKHAGSDMDKSGLPGLHALFGNKDIVKTALHGLNNANAQEVDGDDVQQNVKSVIGVSQGLFFGAGR